MKNQPSKLLLALTVCFSMAAAHAEGDNGNKNQHSNKDTSGRSVTVAAADSCSAKVVATACGPVQVTVCSTNGSTTSTAVSNAQKNKDTERHKDDGKDRGDGKDHNEHNHSTDVNDKNSVYSKRDASKDDTDDTIGKPYGYHWEQTNSSGAKQRKVTVCHREGGARTTIDVDDDGRYHGHDQDPMDTEGACEDQDDKTGKHTDAKNNGRAVVAIHKDAVCGVGRAYQDKSGDGKHHIERDHHADENDSGSKYRTRHTSKDYGSDGYHWVYEMDTNTAHDQKKVIVCHRMGNARVTLSVDDDGWTHGHNKHPNDTVGRCEDQDDNTHRYTAGALSGQQHVRVATETACSSTSGSSTVTTSAACTNAGGVTTVLGGLGCGTAGVSCAPLSTGTRPIRGGLRNVR